MHPAAGDLSLRTGVEVGLEEKVLPILRVAGVDHDRAVGEMDVIERVDHPLLLDGGSGADGLEDILMMEGSGRQRELPIRRASAALPSPRQNGDLSCLGPS